MDFTFQEVDGDQPIALWLTDRLRKFIKEQYGVDAIVTLHIDTPVFKEGKNLSGGKKAERTN